MKDSDLLATARERFKRSAEAEDDQRVLSRDDFDFVAGEQWDDDTLEQRRRDGRPSLTINRLAALVAQAVAAARRSNMAISVSAVEQGDEAISEIYAGMIRAIERVSHADQAYDTALQHAAEGGIGYWRIRT